MYFRYNLVYNNNNVYEISFSQLSLFNKLDLRIRSLSLAALLYLT